MRSSACRSCNSFRRRCRLDVEIQAIIKQLKRKAHLLVTDAEQVGFFNVKQRGEEISTLLDMLERKIVVGQEKKPASKLVPGK